MNKARAFLSLAGLLLIATAACVTSSGAGVGGEVVERSKEQAPAWSALDARRLHRADSGALRYVNGAPGLLDLPLGIKQTQLAALSGSRAALATAATAGARAAAAAAGVDVAGSQALELERIATDVAGDMHAKHMRVTDIYFEKRRAEQAETYSVQILVEMPRAAVDELQQDLARRLARSSSAGLRQVGASLKTAAGDFNFIN